MFGKRRQPARIDDSDDFDHMNIQIEKMKEQ